MAGLKFYVITISTRTLKYSKDHIHKASRVRCIKILNQFFELKLNIELNSSDTSPDVIIPGSSLSSVHHHHFLFVNKSLTLSWITPLLGLNFYSIMIANQTKPLYFPNYLDPLV